MSFIALCCMVSHQPEHLAASRPILTTPVLTNFYHQSHHRFATRNFGVSTRCGIVYSGRCLLIPQGWHRPEDKMEGPHFEALPILCSSGRVSRFAAELGQRQSRSVETGPRSTSQAMDSRPRDELANWF